MSEEFLIGEAILDSSKKFEKTLDFSVPEGDHVYRVLPPMHSLAKANRYSFYWGIHWPYHGKKKKPDGVTPVKYPIACIEVSDYKTKMIKEHCPICDLVRERKRELEFLTNTGKITKEQASLFNTQKIMPFDRDGKYYMNAINSEGKIGVLKIPKKCKDSLEALANKLEKEEGIRPLGINGIFLNFHRRGKGRDTVYEVTPFLQQDPTNPRAKIYKEHVINSAEFIERLKKESVDLTKKFMKLSFDDMAAIVNAADSERPDVIDRIMSRGREQAPNQVAEGLVNIPGTGALGVSRVEFDQNLDLKSVAPAIPNPGFSQKVVKVEAPVVVETKADPFVGAPQAAIEALPDLEDDEAFKAFMNRY